MARRHRKHRAPVHLRHKILGSILVMMGLALFGGCLLLASLLVDQFMEGYTWELILVDLSLGVGSAVCFLMAWQQLVIAPKRDYLEQSFRPTYRRPPTTHDKTAP